MAPTPDDDRRFMALALHEARKGVGLTSPNPPVGAAVVTPDGRLLGKGWHHRAGAPHAEIEALTAAGGPEACRGAVVYITLEPCSTQGRTPPCVDSLINAGVSRVVWAVDDPNPAHDGRAATLLEARGIQVRRGVLAEEAASLLAPWRKFITTRRPWVIAKAGISLDGKLTRPRGEGQWITNDLARSDAQRLRRRADAILIGAETLRRDDPSLTLRPPRPGKPQPWRVVLSRSGRLPPQARLFTDDFRDRTLVLGGEPLPVLLQSLAERGVVTVLIEGGGAVLAQAFAQQLVDEAVFYVAPLLCGTGRPVLDPGFFAGGSVRLEQARWKSLGDNVRVSGLITKAPAE
jgi:diaminohydroxyphosphoribosylaminopyrimidine deaminase/5-amino-6-(5-phosphoribosylamino)uracil reductase